MFIHLALPYYIFQKQLLTSSYRLDPMQSMAFLWTSDSGNMGRPHCPVSIFSKEWRGRQGPQERRSHAGQDTLSKELRKGTWTLLGRTALFKEGKEWASRLLNQCPQEPEKRSETKVSSDLTGIHPRVARLSGSQVPGPNCTVWTVLIVLQDQQNVLSKMWPWPIVCPWGWVSF